MIASTLPPISSTLSHDTDMRELVELFVEDIPQKIAAFETNFADNNWDKLRHLAHQLKGSAGGYGFDCVTQYARKVEQVTQAAQPELEDVRVCIHELIAMLRRLSI